MAVPGYQGFMLPLLRLAADKQEHSIAEAMEIFAEQLKISEVDQNESLPSGMQTRFYNRVTWAVTYLTKSKLLEKAGRGRFRIGTRGEEVLRQDPARVDNSFLEQFAEYREFKTKRNKPETSDRDTDETTEIVVEPDVTPDERLDAAYKELREAVADELSQRARAAAPKFFERLVVDLLVAMGYGGSRVDAAQVVGKSGDGGIDGTIKEDRLGLDVIYVQAKRWADSVGRKEIQSFAGSLEGERANKGVFITTSTFTAESREYVRKIGKKIVLIDGDELADLMIDHGVGVADQKNYTVKKVDSDYFEGF